MLYIRDAIKHCEDMAQGNSKCAKDHAQLAEWLKENIKYKAAIDTKIEGCHFIRSGYKECPSILACPLSEWCSLGKEGVA